MQLSPLQDEGVKLILRAPRGVVTGGPGTGKTTILREAVLELAKNRASYLLLAPTGKAARRMTEVTASEAFTVHRALFSLETHVPDVIILDEASMLDTSLLATLIRKLKYSTRLILIGDADQLPSIGPGVVFSDFIHSGHVPVIRLTHVHRSGPGSWVCNTAPEILKGKFDYNKTEDFEFIECRDKAKAAALVCELAAKYQPKDHQVLVPMHRGILGTYNLNNTLQAESRKKRGDDSVGVAVRGGKNPVTFFKDDPVMQIVNDYDRRIFNGESGFIEKTGLSEYNPQMAMEVKFDSGPQYYSPGQLEENLQLSYAITIHKFQGSETPTVILVCHEDHEFMWSRQLLYTAVTRARQKVYIVGTKNTVERALRTDQPKNRLTTLKERIRES